MTHTYKQERAQCRMLTSNWWYVADPHDGERNYLQGNE